MLNLGQVVYDTTNDRVLIFGGVEMLQDQKTGKCHSEVNFLTEDMEHLFYGDGDERPFKYRNFDAVDGTIPTGSFIAAVGVRGCFFGNLDFDKIKEDDALVEAIEKTFEEAKTWPKPTKEGL